MGKVNIAKGQKFELVDEIVFFWGGGRSQRSFPAGKRGTITKVYKDDFDLQIEDFEITLSKDVFLKDLEEGKVTLI